LTGHKWYVMAFLFYRMPTYVERRKLNTETRDSLSEIVYRKCWLNFFKKD